MNILLDYLFPITAIVPTPQASTAFLKQVCLIVKPKEAVPTGTITLCTSMSAVAALTDNVDAQQLFSAGMNRVYILPMDDLDLEEALDGHESDFYTLLVSSDFNDNDILEGIETPLVPAVKAQVKIQDILYRAKTGGVGGNAITVSYIEDTATGNQAIVGVSTNAITVDIDASATTAETIANAIEGSTPANALVEVIVDDGDESDIQAVTGSPVSLAGGVNEIPAVPGGDGLKLGNYKGVVGVYSDDDEFLEDQAVIENRSAFHSTVTNKAKNMAYAFGKLLSNALSWNNQQYIQMPLADDVSTLGDANNLFDSKISFVLDDTQYGKRLGLFAVGGKAIVAPYITKNLQIDLQSRALNYISGNQPNYTKVQAALLEDELQKVIDSYIQRQWIEAGVIEIKLEQDNFVASGYINIAEPKALWRIFAEMQQTL